MLHDLIKAAEAVQDARGSMRPAFDMALDDLKATVESVKAEFSHTHDFLAKAQGVVKAFWSHPQQLPLGKPSDAQMQGFAVLLAVKMREATGEAATAEYWRRRAEYAESDLRTLFTLVDEQKRAVDFLKARRDVDAERQSR